MYRKIGFVAVAALIGTAALAASGDSADDNSWVPGPDSLVLGT